MKANYIKFAFIVLKNKIKLLFDKMKNISENINEKALIAMFELRRTCINVKFNSGWKLIQKALPRILEYGRSVGILPLKCEKVFLKIFLN